MYLLASTLKGNLGIDCVLHHEDIQIGLSNPNLVKGLAATWIAPIWRILNLSLCNCSRSLGSRSSIVSVSDPIE